MNLPLQRGENYNTEPPGAEAAEVAVNRTAGLDFSGEERVNPEDLIGGNPMELATSSELTNSLDGLECLFKDTPGANPVENEVAEAVIYLRVSTPRQLHTAADIDEDGNSIATQRVETMRKVREMGITASREFIEPGQSAQTIAKRAEFKKMLRFIDENPQVKYVVIYMRSRVFRNFTDAAVVKRELLAKGVRLISAKEEFGEGYMADAMEAITDVMNEVQVRMNGEDVKVKMAHKVEQGGSIGVAKLGYLNIRKSFSGRFVNTIEIDPERAPLVALAFETYATGEYSIAQLTTHMQEQGLTMRPSPSRPERPLNKSSLASMLRNPYYTGVMRYKGKLYVGRHQAIVSKEVFLKVQEILDARNRDGDRDVTHRHYLKGLLACGQCIDEGRRSRLVYSRSTGNGGTYEYYICSARTRVFCGTIGFRTELLEDEIVKLMNAEQFDRQTIEDLADLVKETVDMLLAADKETKAGLARQLKQLEAQEERLIDLAANGTYGIPRLRDKLEETTLQKGLVQEKLARTVDRLRYSAETALAYLALLSNPGELYRNAPDNVRRDLLEAFFVRLRVYEDGEDVRIEMERNEVNQAFHDAAETVQAARRQTRVGKPKAPRETAGSLDVSEEMPVHLALGLNKNTLAGVPGLEPRITEPETVVLPITPYPKGETRASHRESSLPEPDPEAKTQTTRCPSGASRRAAHQGVSPSARRRARKFEALTRLPQVFIAHHSRRCPRDLSTYTCVHSGRAHSRSRSPSSPPTISTACRASEERLCARSPVLRTVPSRRTPSGLPSATRFTISTAGPGIAFPCRRESTSR